MQDEHVDTDLDDDEDIDNPDDTSDPEGDDNDESKEKQTGSDPDPDTANDEPDEDGYTAEERKELEEWRNRHKKASDKISADGQTIKEKDAEIAKLREELNEKRSRSRDDESDDETRRRTPRTTRRRTDDPDPDDDPDFSDIDMNKLDPNTRRAFARMFDQNQKTAAKSQEIQTRLDESEAENERLKAQDTLYGQYQRNYGISREQFNEVFEARESGDHIGADRLLQVHSSAAKRRQERAESMNDESGYLPTGSPDTPKTPRRPSRRDELQKEYDEAKTEAEKARISEIIWTEFDADVATEMTLPFN